MSRWSTTTTSECRAKWWGDERLTSIRFSRAAERLQNIIDDSWVPLNDERIRSSEACISCCLTNFQEPKLMFFQAQVLSYAILFLWNHSSQDVHLQGVTFFKLIWWRSCDLYNLLTSVVHHQHLGILMQRGRYSLRISNPLDGRPIRRPNSGAVGGHMDFQQLEKTCWNHFSCFFLLFFFFQLFFLLEPFGVEEVVSLDFHYFRRIRGHFLVVQHRFMNTLSSNVYTGKKRKNPWWMVQTWV